MASTQRLPRGHVTKEPIERSGVAEEDIKALRTCLEGGEFGTDTDETRTLCAMLAAIQIPAAGEALRELSRHAHENLRTAAVRVFGERLTEPETMDRLRFALGDARARVVKVAVDVVREHKLAAFRNELRALAAMPNESASSDWLHIANEALATLAEFCSVEDLDLGTRAFSDQKLERGGSLLLDALARHLPLDSLLPFAADQRELSTQLVAGLATRNGAQRLEELAACGTEPIASIAKISRRAWQEKSLPPYIAVNDRLPLDAIRKQQHDGSNDLQYRFCLNEELNQRLEGLLNCACRLFHRHGKDNWLATHRDDQAAQVCPEIRANPWLIRRLFALKDPVVASLAYRAIQLRDM